MHCQSPSPEKVVAPPRSRLGIAARAGMIGLALGGLADRARADLPQGFEKSEVTCCFSQPLAFEFLPGINGGPERILIAERCGRLVVFDGPELPTMLQIENTSCDEEWGLLGLAIDPSFETNGYIYTYYTTADLRARVSRFTAIGDFSSLGTEVILWENPQPADATSHHGGNLAFGPDGMLYIATGEELQSQWAQDMSSQRGKILRLNPDGSVPADNPYVGVAGVDPFIWASGFRNPFRFTFDPPTGRMYVGDVGFSSWEEIDRVAPTNNLGWADMEGPQCYTGDCSKYTAPIWWYDHMDHAYSVHGDASITCGPVYRGANFPAGYDGNIFVGDYVNGWIRRLILDDDGVVVGEEVFESAPDAGTVVDLKVGPDGALYYTAIFGGSTVNEGIYRIAYTGTTNIAPVAVVAPIIDPVPVSAPRTVEFRGSLSRDPDHGPAPLRFSWDFGDGGDSKLANPSHTYATRGEFLAQLTVSDGTSSDRALPLRVRTGRPPEGNIATPTEGTRYRAGDTINFSGTAYSPDLGPLDASSMTWNVVIAHDTHQHPFYGPITGVSEGSFTIPSSGHPPEDIHFLISRVITDPDGITSYQQREIFPDESFLQLDSSPTGIPVFLDENPLSTPRTYQSVAGFHHAARAQVAYILDGQAYHFVGWQSGTGTATGKTLDFVSPEGGTWLTAVYAPGCAADFDTSGFVDTEDFSAFTVAFEAGEPSADFDLSGFVDTDDFDAFVVAFIQGC